MIEPVVLYVLSGLLFVYAAFNQILILIKNAQTKFWLSERRKEILAHRAELEAARNGTKIPFPPGRTIKEGLEPLPPVENPKPMTQELFDRTEYSILQMRHNEAAKYMCLKTLYRQHPQFAKR